MTPPDGDGVEHGARGCPAPGYLCQADGTPHTAETFDWVVHLATLLGTDDPEVQAELLMLPKVRRTITRTDPLAFAVLYFPHHLRGQETHDKITFSDAHLGWARMARQWLRPSTEPREDRVAEFAPRATGKTTWWFLIIPAWAAAHKIIRFVAAFADTYDQATGHLRTFRNELLTNVMLRVDYPGLVHATRNTEFRELTADKEDLLITATAFVFAARGADTSSLGLKVGERRPDLIILDDIEPHEGKYSLASVKKRQHTLTDAILPLNEFARVVWVGTTTRHGGLAHHLVSHANGHPLDDSDWVPTQKFRPSKWDPIMTRDDGTERSLWPGKWDLEFLQSIRGTRDYAKNYDNEPVSEDGDYWSPTDFTYEVPDMFGNTVNLHHNILVLDPDVNDLHEESDWTGVCVAGQEPDSKRVVIRELTHVRLTGRRLADYCLKLLERFPQTQRIVIEVNQGVTLWVDIFADFPIPVDLVMADYPKPVRASMALNHYQARPTRVVHERQFQAAESQMMSFPNAVNDDMVDAASWAVRYLLEPKTIRRPKGFVLKRRPRTTVSSYV